MSKRITIVSDSPPHLTNGVRTWFLNTERILTQQGFIVTLIHAGQFRTIALPFYPEIPLVIATRGTIERLLRESNPDFVHIVTEGPLGLLARSACLKIGWKFTTAYHTRFPDYLYTYTKLTFIKHTTYAYLRWFHNASSGTMVTTDSLYNELKEKRFTNLTRTPLGVDTTLFKKNDKATIPEGLHAPIFTYVGRVSSEKNLEAFLTCDLPGSKVIVGDGPAKNTLERQYGNTVRFTGYQTGQQLVDLLSISNVFVFPSTTDTFGVSMIEALACGVPVAAYPVPGPQDIVTNGVDGFLGENLAESALKCLTLSSDACRKKAEAFSWERSVSQFVDHLVAL